jgi:hypothetical protein
LVGEGRGKEPPAKQERQFGGAPRAPSFGDTDKMLDIADRNGREQSIYIGKPFKPVPPVDCAVHAEIDEEIFPA